MSDSAVSTKVLTVANILTFLRMGLIPLFAILLVYHRDGWALVVFTIAGVSDGIDGFIARRMKQESELGTIIDPIADKLLMTVAFIILTLPNVLPPTRHLPIPFWVTASVIGRDVLIITVAAAINIITGVRGFQPSFWGKVSTLVQVIGISLVMIAAVTGYTFFLPTTYFIIVLLVVISGVHYIFQVASLMNKEEASSSENA